MILKQYRIGSYNMVTVKFRRVRRFQLNCYACPKFRIPGDCLLYNNGEELSAEFIYKLELRDRFGYPILSHYVYYYSPLK